MCPLQVLLAGREESPGHHQFDYTTHVVRTAVGGLHLCAEQEFFAAGGRCNHREFQRGRIASGGDTSAGCDSFEGDGLTASIEFRRQVTCNVGVFGQVRTSVLLGDEINLAFFDPMPGDSGDPDVFIDQSINDAKFIYELSAGVEYVLPICSGGYYFVRGGVEIQYWDSFGVDNSPWDGEGEDVSYKNASVAFGGFILSAGLQR